MLLDMYLHHASELILKIHHTSDLPQILLKGLNHYTIVYGLDSRKIRKSIVGHWNVQWRSMEDYFRDIHAFGAGYERAKGCGRAEYNFPEASTNNDVMSKKDPGPCFKCSGPHFQNTCTKYTNQLATNL